MLLAAKEGDEFFMGIFTQKETEKMYKRYNRKNSQNERNTQAYNSKFQLKVKLEKEKKREECVIVEKVSDIR